MRQLKGLILALLMMALCSVCRAQCSPSEVSSGSKARHFASSFGLAFLGSALSGKPSHGFMGGVVLSGLKEGYDHVFNDQCGSSVEMAFSVAGAAAGAITAKAAGLTRHPEPPSTGAAPQAPADTPINTIAAQNDFRDDSVQVQRTRPSGVYFLSGGGLVSVQNGSSNLGLKVSARRIRLVYTAALSL